MFCCKMYFAKIVDLPENVYIFTKNMVWSQNNLSPNRREVTLCRNVGLQIEKRIWIELRPTVHRSSYPGTGGPTSKDPNPRIPALEFLIPVLL